MLGIIGNLAEVEGEVVEEAEAEGVEEAEVEEEVGVDSRKIYPLSSVS